MKIYGYKLPTLNDKFYVSREEIDYYKDLLHLTEIIHPEKEFDPACHIYTDFHSGHQYLGFEITLGLSYSEMRKILGEEKKSKIYHIKI